MTRSRHRIQLALGFVAFLNGLSGISGPVKGVGSGIVQYQRLLAPGANVPMAF